jgi:hypothetical protein
MSRTCVTSAVIVVLTATGGTAAHIPGGVPPAMARSARTVLEIPDFFRKDHVHAALIVSPAGTGET